MREIFEKKLPDKWNITTDGKSKFPLMKCLERLEIKFEGPALTPEMILAGVVKSTYSTVKAAQADLENTVRILKMRLLKQVPSYLNHGEVTVNKSADNFIHITIPLYVFPGVSSALGAIIFRQETVIYVAYAGDYNNARVLADIIVKNSPPPHIDS